MIILYRRLSAVLSAPFERIEALNFKKIQTTVCAGFICCLVVAGELAAQTSEDDLLDQAGDYSPQITFEEVIIRSEPPPELPDAQIPELDDTATKPQDLKPPVTDTEARTDTKVSQGRVGTAADLRQIYELARVNDPRILAADFEMQAAQFDIPIAKASRYPEFNVEVRQRLLFGESIEGDSEFRTAPALRLDVPIYNRASNVNVALAEGVVEEAVTNFQRQEQALFLRTAELYFALLRAQDAESIARAAFEAIEGQVGLARELLEEQLVAVFDLKEAEASLDSAQASVIEAQGEVSAAKEALRVTINQQPPVLARIGENTKLALPLPNDVEHWVEKGFSNSLALKVARLQNARVELELKLAKAGHYPTVGFFLRYGSTGSEVLDSDEDRSGELTLRFDWTLFQGGRVEARKSQLDLTRQQLQQQLVFAQRSVEQQVRNAFERVQISYQRSLAFEQAVVSNLESLELIQEGVKEQVRTIVDLLEVTSRYTRAQRELSSARYDFLFNVLQLNAFSGGISIEELSSLDEFLE